MPIVAPEERGPTLKHGRETTKLRRLEDFGVPAIASDPGIGRRHRGGGSNGRHNLIHAPRAFQVDGAVRAGHPDQVKVEVVQTRDYGTRPGFDQARAGRSRRMDLAFGPGHDHRPIGDANRLGGLETEADICPFRRIPQGPLLPN